MLFGFPKAHTSKVGKEVIGSLKLKQNKVKQRIIGGDRAGSPWGFGRSAQLLL